MELSLDQPFEGAAAYDFIHEGFRVKLAYHGMVSELHALSLWVGK